MTKKMTKDELKDRISMALKAPVLQQSFEIICKENAELKAIADFQTSSNMDRYFQLKRGETVARKGWNGKGMFLTLQNGSEVDGNNMRNEGARNYYADCKCKIAPHIDMKSADGTYVVGWLASQTEEQRNFLLKKLNNKYVKHLRG